MDDAPPSYTASWTYLGTTAAGKIYEVNPDAWAVVPSADLYDTELTARSHVTFMNEQLPKRGIRVALVIMLDRILSQDRGARTVYEKEPDAKWITCVALVGGSVFGRAVGSLFLGLGRVAVPTKMFATVEAGLAWIAEMKARASTSP